MSFPSKQQPGEIIPGGHLGAWSAQIALGLVGMAIVGETISASYSSTLIGRAASAVYLMLMVVAFANAYVAAEMLDEEAR